MDTYQARAQKAARQFAEKAVYEGLRAFLAEAGHYGFIQSPANGRIVSFQYDRLLGCVTVSGNYRSTDGRKCGSGWNIGEYSPDGELHITPFLDARPPNWTGVHATEWHYTTLEECLAAYQRSSKYRELVLHCDDCGRQACGEYQGRQYCEYCGDEKPALSFQLQDIPEAVAEASQQ